MRILILSNKSGGLVDFRLELINELLQKHEICIATPFDDKIEELKNIPVTLFETFVDRRGINPIKDCRLCLSYFRIISKVKPDLVVTYTIKPNIYGGFACKLKRIQYAANITGLGTAFERGGLLRKIVTLMYKSSLKKAKVVFFENSANQQLFIDEEIVKEDQTCLLNGAGVNLEHYSYTEYLHNDKLHFLFIGRVMKEKGIDELLEAMQRLVNDGQNCCLDVVGPCEDDYEDILKKHEQEGWLNYYGFQEDVRPFIKACDCFVLPSYHEGMANTNLECAAMGRLIITSDIPGCREAVDNGVTGFLCKRQDIDDLYRVMKKLIELSIQERSDMGKEGRNLMCLLFNKEKVIQETIKRLT